MDALREGAGSLMCSYQRINNSYGCQNSKLLNGILKEELGFEGFVVCNVLTNFYARTNEI
jgi:beta-glucosidase